MNPGPLDGVTAMIDAHSCFVRRFRTTKAGIFFGTTRGMRCVTVMPRGEADEGSTPARSQMELAVSVILYILVLLVQ